MNQGIDKHAKTRVEVEALGFDVAGAGLWVNGNRGTATCNADTYGVLSNGVWVV